MSINKCPFHPSMPDLVQRTSVDDVYQYLTNPDKADLWNQWKLYIIPFIWWQLWDIYWIISWSAIQVLKDPYARDALDYIRTDVHERKKIWTDKAVCPFENAFFNSNGYGYKVYAITQANLRELLEKSVNDYSMFAQTINTKHSLLCVILDDNQKDPELLAYLERELIRMKNDVYTAQGYMGWFVASQTLAWAARVSHVWREHDVQLLEKGPFEKHGKPMVMTREAHYWSPGLVSKDLFNADKASYSEKFAINFWDYGSYRNPLQILNGINAHIGKEDLNVSQVSYLWQNLYKLYNDFFFEWQQGDNGEFSGKIAYDKNKIQVYRDSNEQSPDKVMNYFYEQYICLLSEKDQQTIYQVLKDNISQWLDMIEWLIVQYEEQYKQLIKLLQQYWTELTKFSQDTETCLSWFRSVTLTNYQS